MNGDLIPLRYGEAVHAVSRSLNEPPWISIVFWRERSDERKRDHLEGFIYAL